MNQTVMLLTTGPEAQLAVKQNMKGFFTPETERVQEQLLVATSVRLGWCLCDAVDLFLMLASWWLLLQPSCPHSGREEGVKGWHKLSSAKQKHSQRVANRLWL